MGYRNKASKPNPRTVRSANVDEATDLGFGEEWSSYAQEKLEGFDLRCGTGRWAALVAWRKSRD